MSRRLGLALGLAAYASWGLLSPVGKHLLDEGHFTPLWMNAIRFVAATAVLLPLLGAAAARDSVRLCLSKPVAEANLWANLSLTLFLYSMTLLPATHATLGFYTAPLWTAALAALWLGERAGWPFAAAAAALLGGGYLALFGAASPGPFSALGLGLAVASAIVWALYTVRLRTASLTVGLKPLMGASFLLGSAWFVALSILLEGLPRIPSEAIAWGWMALYVAIPTLASFVLFNAALKLAPASSVNILVGAELAFTALFAATLFGDRFAPSQVVGLAVVLGSVTAYLWWTSRPAKGQPSL